VSLPSSSTAVDFPIKLGAAQESAELTRAFAKAAWRLLPLLCACYIAAYLDRIVVGFAKLQMLGELGFSEAVYGLGAGIFFVGYVLFEVPSNIILERIGARIWIARIMITWGIFAALGAFVQTPTQFYIVRFLLGVGEAGFLPGALFYLSRWFPSYRRSRIVALLMIGIPLSSIIGAPLSGGIIREFHEVAALSGWQWLFLLTGMPTIILGFVALWLLPERPKDAKWLSASEQQVLQAALDADQSSATHTKKALRDGLLDPKVWILGAIDFTLLVSLYVIGFWLPTFIRSAGVADTFQIGMLTAIPHICGLVTMIVVSISSDRFRERKLHIIVPFLISAAALASSTQVSPTDIVLIVVLFSLANAGIQGALPAFFSLPTTFLSGPAAATGFAMVTSIANIAGLVSNSIMGFALDLTGSSSAALLVFAACLVVGALLVSSLPARIVNR